MNHGAARLVVCGNQPNPARHDIALHLPARPCIMQVSTWLGSACGEWCLRQDTNDQVETRKRAIEEVFFSKSKNPQTLHNYILTSVGTQVDGG
jgi:hypothetical protein